MVKYDTATKSDTELSINCSISVVEKWPETLLISNQIPSWDFRVNPCLVSHPSGDRIQHFQCADSPIVDPVDVDSFRVASATNYSKVTFVSAIVKCSSSISQRSQSVANSTPTLGKSNIRSSLLHVALPLIASTTPARNRVCIRTYYDSQFV